MSFPSPFVPSIAALLLAAAIAGPAVAQSNAATGKTLSGKPASAGPILTKEELRACMNRQTELDARKQTIQQQGQALLTEREAIVKQSEALKADKQAVESETPAMREFNDKMKAHEAAVQDLNARIKAFNETGSKARDAEKQQKQLADDKVRIDKEAADLNAQRQSLVGNVQASAQQINERAAAVNAKSDDWNARNTKQRQAEDDFEIDRELWQSECGGRRYREDDEKAIRAGK